MYKVKQPIYAMAAINPTLCRELNIFVEVEQRDEGPIPHIHVYLDKTRDPRNCAYVRLDTGEYMEKHRSVKLKKDQIDSFMKIMMRLDPDVYIKSTVTDEVRLANGYESAVLTYRRTYPTAKSVDYDEAGFPIMPDFRSKLKKSPSPIK